MRLRIKQMAQGHTRRLQTRHERLWAEECVSLHRRVCVMNEIRSFDADNPGNVVKFRGLSVLRLLSGEVRRPPHPF